jgi:phosphoglycolate phosphatase
MTTRPLAIFDFDGTIADSMAAAVSVYNEAAIRLRIPQITAENGRDLRRMKPREAMKAFGVPLWKLPLIMTAVRAGMRGRSEALEPFPGMGAALRDLRAAGCGCCILSSNTRENIEPFLARHGIQPFDRFSCGASLFGKGAQLRKLLRSLKSSPAEAFYVGDEVRDINAAAEAGIRSVAVSWGYGDRAALAAERPDFLVDTPAELVRIIAGR